MVSENVADRGCKTLVELDLQGLKGVRRECTVHTHCASASAFAFITDLGESSSRRDLQVGSVGSRLGKERSTYSTIDWLVSLIENLSTIKDLEEMPVKDFRQPSCTQTRLRVSS